MNTKLRRLRRTPVSPGITANYAGFNYMVYALSPAPEEPARVQSVTKLIYPDAAGRCGTGAKCAERSIRTVIWLAWERNPALLSQMAGCPLKNRPSNSSFPAIVTIWLSSD